MDLLFLFGGIVLGTLAASVAWQRRLSEHQRAAEARSLKLEEQVHRFEDQAREQAARLTESRHREDAAQRALQEEARLRAASEETAKRVPGLEGTVVQQNTELTNLRAELASLRTQIVDERRNLEEKMGILNDARAHLQDAFKGLSAEALRSNNEAFLQLARENLERFQQGAVADLDARRQAVDDVVRPLREHLGHVQVKLGELERQRLQAYSALDEQLKALVQLHLPQLHSETLNLVKALRQPSGRGRWGELQLRRVVEMAGMQPHCDFTEQTTATTDNGRLRPDLIVCLPGERRLVVDAKAPVDAYLNAIEAGDDESRRRFLVQHATQVRNHIAILAKKEYFEQFEITPDFVIMFIPGEAFFSAALEFDPGLIEHGVEQRVIPASPTILIALLKAVAYGWRQEAVTRNAQEVAELGADLYRRISDLADRWGEIGKRLGQMVEAYNKAVATLETRVLVTARRFAGLGVARHDDSIAPVEPVERAPRVLAAPEMIRHDALALESPRSTTEDERN